MHMHVGISLLNISVGRKCRRSVCVLLCGSRCGKLHFRKPGLQLRCDKVENKSSKALESVGQHKYIESVSQSAFPNLPNYLCSK